MEQVGTDRNLGNGLHIARLNVRSLVGDHKFDVLKHQVKSSGIQVFMMSESWLTEAIPEYNSARGDRQWNDKRNGRDQIPKRGGGLVCYIKEGIKYSDRKYSNINISCKDPEMMWIILYLENVRPIVIVNVYRPPQGSYAKVL